MLCCDGLLVFPATDAIESEAVLFGHPVSITLPSVVGCHISGTVSCFCSSTDNVLAITKVCQSDLSVISLSLMKVFVDIS